MKVLDRENKEIILLRDTNCDILPKYLDGDGLSNNLPTHSMRILEFYNLFGFQQLIETGTRETLLSSTPLDHIARTSKSNIVTSGVYETSISDHYLVYCVRKFRGACKKQHKYITTRQLKHSDEAESINDLLLVDWKAIALNGNDISIIVEQWTNMFSLILEKHAPVRNRRVSENFCPWLTKELKQLSVTRDRLKKQAVRFKSDILMEAYRQTRNKVNMLNMELRGEFFTTKIASQNGDLKSAWKTINTVLNKKSKATQIATLEVDGSLISDSNSTAESMNNFFCSIGNTRSGKIPETANHLLENECTVNSQNLCFELKAIDMCQLEKIFNTFKKSKGSGADGIANYFLKIGQSAVIEPLCDIFNLSIATGIFPDSWKIARVAPIFRSGQTNDRSSYGPTLVLPFASRVFEKLIYNQLYDYLDTSKLLFSKESGFRFLHSVLTCQPKCTNDWYLDMDKGQYTVMIFVNLKKAFDNVNHEILLKKLEKYCVIGSENAWFASYLCIRRQFC